MARTKTSPKKARRGLPSTPAPERASQVQALGRALAVLNRLADADAGVSLTEISRQVGLATSTAHRLLTTLEHDRYVRFDPETRLWFVGVQAFITGNAFLKTRDFVQMSRRHLRNLMEQSGETVNLAVPDKGEAVYLAQVECREMMRAFARPGARVPLHCSAVGKALLAAMPEEELNEALRRRSLSRLTPRTIVTPATLRADLIQARERGYAIDDEEHAIGLRCAAAALFNEHGESIGAISLSGPAARIPPDRIPLLGDLVKKTAAAVTTELGGRLPFQES